MSKENQRRAMIAGAGLIVLYLIYRWRQAQSNTNAAATGTSAPATDTSASDYASLAGQEQGDVAALQQQNQQILAQEQSDVANEQQSITGLTGLVGALGTAVSSFTPPDLSGLTSQIAALALGEQQLQRQLSAQKPKPSSKGGKRGGGTRTTGTTARRDAQQTSAAAGALARARGAAQLQPAAHASAPHNTHVAHPNAGHAPKTGGHRTLPKPKTPAPHTKVRSSGRRR